MWRKTINIFYLSKNPKECAIYHNDKWTVKMILEYNQLLSTAHRMLDGNLYIDKSTGRNVKRYKLDNNLDSILYKATHLNHPSALWVRQSDSNYKWLHSLLVELCSEYTYRYGKIHKCQQIGLVDALKCLPSNIPNKPFTEPTPAMPDEYIVHGDSIQSYINYYNGSKRHLHFWKNREAPYFIK